MKSLVLISVLSFSVWNAFAQEPPVARPGSNQLIDKQLRELGPEVKLDPFQEARPAGALPRFQLLRPPGFSPEIHRREFRPEPPPAPAPVSLPAAPKAARTDEIVWKLVTEEVSRALEVQGVEAGVKDKVMKAIGQARAEADAREARRFALEAEARRLEAEIQALQKRVDSIRSELNRSGE